MALIEAFFHEQNSVTKNRIFRDRLNPLDAYDDAEILCRFRMNRQCIMEVIDLIRDDISHETMRSFAISPEQQTFAALRFYATGSFQQVTGDIMGISQPSVSRIVQQVSTAISRHAGRFITFPVTAPQQQYVKEGFMERFGFPNILGCVDGTLVQIKAPSVREDAYVCRKGYHALNIQGICDSRKAFLNLVVRWPGSTHDAFIWSECGINSYLNDNPNAGYLLGDQAYPLKQFLLTPNVTVQFGYPHVKRNPVNNADHAYNRLHQKTRQLIEDTFGRWKCRWLMLHKFGGAITIELRNAIKAIVATGVLHNICEKKGIPLPNEDLINTDYEGNDEMYDNGEIVEDGEVFRSRLIKERF